MSHVMLHPDPHAVKHHKFIAATEADQEKFERDLGCNLYKRGKPLSECRTDAMTQGWLTAEAAGADAYWRAMMAEAVN